MEVLGFILYMFASFGFITTLLIIWNETSDMRYDFKLKYILKPKFRKDDYAIVPNRHNDPTLVLIESVSSDWKEKKVEYIVHPVTYSNEYIDYDYFDRLVFSENCLMKIKDYYVNGWEEMIRKSEDE